MGDETIDKIITEFRRYPRLAEVFVGRERSEVQIKYESASMEIRNLIEFVPYLKIDLDTSNAFGIKASNDGLEWNPIDDTAFLSIYCLYNPVFILPQISTSFQQIHRYATDVFEATYDIRTLPLSQEAKDFFVMNNEKLRKIWLHTNHPRERDYGQLFLLSMVQKDFPPFNDMITLRFYGQT